MKYDYFTRPATSDGRYILDLAGRQKQLLDLNQGGAAIWTGDLPSYNFMSGTHLFLNKTGTGAFLLTANMGITAAGKPYPIQLLSKHFDESAATVLSSYAPSEFSITDFGRSANSQVPVLSDSEQSLVFRIYNYHAPSGQGDPNWVVWQSLKGGETISCPLTGTEASGNPSRAFSLGIIDEAEKIVGIYTYDWGMHDSKPGLYRIDMKTCGISALPDRQAAKSRNPVSFLLRAGKSYYADRNGIFETATGNPLLRVCQ